MKKILFLALLLTLASCSKKGAGTPAKLRLLSSAMTAGLTTAGGAIITGKSSTGEAFQMGLQLGSEATDIELTPGSWEFAAITWENESGNGPMTGTNRCALTTASIEGEEVVVDLNLSPATCSNSFFTKPINVSGDQFNPLVLHACSSLSHVNSFSSQCNPAQFTGGNNLSYRVVFQGRNLATGANLSSLASGCINALGDLTSSFFYTSYKLPINDNGNFPFVILAYEDLNCEADDLEATYLFQSSKHLPTIEQADSLTYEEAGETHFFFADNYIGHGGNTFANSGMLPPYQSLSSRYDDPTQSGGSGDAFDNTRDVFVNILGTTNLTSPWTLGRRANSPGGIFDGNTTIIDIETINPTSVYNGTQIDFSYGGSTCATSSSHTTAPLSITINYCDNIDAVPTITTTDDIVAEINTALTNAGLTSDFTVTNITPGANIASPIASSVMIDNGQEPESPWKRNTGLYGEIAGAYHGHLGAILHRAGFLTCSEIPTSGSLNYDLGEGDIITFQFSTGKIPMAEWMNSSGTYPAKNIFEKRIAFIEEGVMREFYEFNCSGNILAGFYRSNYIDGGEDHRVEAYWDAQDNDNLIFESIVYDKRNEPGNNYERKEWNFVKNDNIAPMVELWSARNYNDITNSINQGDVYSAKIDSGFIYTSAKHYTLAQLTVDPIDFVTNTDVNTKYGLDGTNAGATGHQINPPNDPSTLAINKLQFPKIMSAIPGNLAPMSLNDPRLFTGFGPNVTYQAYQRTMDFFDYWKNLDFGTNQGCIYDGTGLNEIFLEPSHYIFTGSENLAYSHLGLSMISDIHLYSDADGCTGITWDTNFNMITIDPASIDDIAGGGPLSYSELQPGTTFDFALSGNISGVNYPSWANTLVATNEDLNVVNNGGMRLVGDQSYTPTMIDAGSVPTVTAGQTADFFMNVINAYPGTTVTTSSTGVSPPSCIVNAASGQITCTPDGSQVASDVYTITIDNVDLGYTDSVTITIP
ncbi:hypothetical protein BIY24_09830 [Halobacteriovorax marinus]|uniref:hypothetical protein n=1 Tax=Halobacteriovorax marinus TaxID=97084 RepID=UPI000BC355A0|nr:hypothetical protein [Halobacteriovorax marinus]ATH08238.1 hypothetical protein BIY24_09830 [Halobacteriovorax marinus]